MAILFQRPPLSANAYYTATTGNDSNPGTLVSPFLTIAKGISVLTAGYTLYVRTGTYDETITSMPSGTSFAAADAVTVAAYPGDTVWMTPTSGNHVLLLNHTEKYIIFDGINMDGSAMALSTIKIEPFIVTTREPHHIRIQNAEIIGQSPSGNGGIIVLDAQFDGATGGNELLSLEIHSGGENDFDHAVYVKSSDNIIGSCNIYDFSGGGLHLYQGGGYAISGNIVKNNTIHDSRSTGAGERHWGIIISLGFSDTQCYNNVVYNIEDEGGNSSGILLLYSGSDNLLYNNTVTMCDSFGINVGNGDASPTATQVKNNISYLNGTNYYDSGTGTITATNLVAVNPLFTDPGTFDFTVMAGSPALNAGTTLASVPTDIVGVTRPAGQYTIGAYQD